MTMFIFIVVTAIVIVVVIVMRRARVSTRLSCSATQRTRAHEGWSAAQVLHSRRFHHVQVGRCSRLTATRRRRAQQTITQQSNALHDCFCRCTTKYTTSSRFPITPIQMITLQYDIESEDSAIAITSLKQFDIEQTFSLNCDWS